MRHPSLLQAPGVRRVLHPGGDLRIGRFRARHPDLRRQEAALVCFRQPDSHADGAAGARAVRPAARVVIPHGRDPLAGRPNRPGRTQYDLYGRYLPLSTILTQSPFGSASRWMSIEKSIALMMPSPNSSWISSFIVEP